jgi:hypothetical protein
MIGSNSGNCNCSIADNLRSTLCSVDPEIASFVMVKDGCTVFTEIFMRSSFRDCAISFLMKRDSLHKFWCSGDGGGVPYRPQNGHGPNQFWFGPWLFLLLILSRAQTGVILCKLSEWGARYERTMDESNYGQRTSSLLWLDKLPEDLCQPPYLQFPKLIVWTD